SIAISVCRSEAGTDQDSSLLMFKASACPAEENSSIVRPVGIRGQSAIRAMPTQTRIEGKERPLSISAEDVYYVDTTKASRRSVFTTEIQQARTLRYLVRMAGGGRSLKWNSTNACCFA